MQEQQPQQYKSIEAIMALYDKKDCKLPDYHIIASSLFADVSEDEKKCPEWVFETTACNVVDDPQGNNNWEGEYFAPLYRHTINEEERVVPAHDTINADAVQYWNRRISETENAMMRARYAGLVWEYGNLAGIKRTGELQKVYVESLVDIANDEVCDDVWIAQKYLRRGLMLSVTRSDLSQKVKEAFRMVNARSKDCQPGIWGVFYKMLLECPKAFSNEETEALLLDGEKRLERLAAKSAKNEDGVTPDIVKQLAEILAEYYNRNKKTADRDRVLGIAEAVHRQHFDGMSASLRFYMLQGIKAMYNAMGNYDHDDALIVEMQKEGKGMIAEMEPHEFAVEIPNEQWEEMKRQLTEGEEELQRAMFVYQFIPKKKALDERMKKEAVQYPLMYMMQNQFMTSEGLPLSVVGGVENDEEGRLIHYTAQHISFESVILHQVIEWHLESGVLSNEYIMNHIKSGPVFDESRYEIIEKGLRFYNDHEYDVACHLWMPQIEAAICKLQMMESHRVLRAQVKRDDKGVRKIGKGYQMRLLDELLGDASLLEIIGEDVSFYLRVLLTEQRGLNYRNELCHGIEAPSRFGQACADRLLHVLIMLGNY